MIGKGEVDSVKTPYREENNRPVTLGSAKFSRVRAAEVFIQSGAKPCDGGWKAVLLSCKTDILYIISDTLYKK